MEALNISVLMNNLSGLLIQLVILYISCLAYYSSIVISYRDTLIKEARNRR